MTGTPMAFFQGELMPLAEAKIGLMTHAFNYGTAVVEGIRANWSAEHEELYLFRTAEHVKRLRRSAKVLEMVEVPRSTSSTSVMAVAAAVMATVSKSLAAWSRVTV